MSKRKNILIIGIIIILVLIIGLIMFFIKYYMESSFYYISDFEKQLSKTENYGGTIIINIDKEDSKSNYCIFLRDTEYNNAVNFSKNPIQVEVCSIDENTNLKLIKMDATYINDVFDHDIDTLYLNFSDPWPKKRHEHRRLTSLRFLKRYDSVFKTKKIIIQKTDNRKLFEYSLKSFTDYNYKIEELSLNLHLDDYDNVETEYERKFSSLGYPIYMVKVVK